MIAHYAETYNSFNHGKFLLLRHDAADLQRRSALPGYEDQLLVSAGRKFGRDEIFVIDLQTGEGCAFTLDSPFDVTYQLNLKHQIWVCPMYEPFVVWLAETHPELRRGGGDISALPPVVELPNAPKAMAGYRRQRDKDDASNS